MEIQGKRVLAAEGMRTQISMWATSGHGYDQIRPIFRGSRRHGSSVVEYAHQPAQITLLPLPLAIGS